MIKSKEDKILFEAIPVEKELPPYPQVVCVLLDGRMKMMAQIRPGDNGPEWWTLGMAQAHNIEEKKKCVTHWLKPMDASQFGYSLKQVEDAYEAGATAESAYTQCFGDSSRDDVSFDKDKATYLASLPSPSPEQPHPLPGTNEQQIQQAAEAYAEQENSAWTNDYNGYVAGATSLLPRIEELEKENGELKAWKESAMIIMEPLQAIGKALDIPLGQSIHDKILPWILEAKAFFDDYKEIQFSKRAKELEAKLKVAKETLELIANNNPAQARKIASSTLNKLT